MLVRRVIIYYVYFASAILINTKELLPNFIFLSFRPLVVKSGNILGCLWSSWIPGVTTGHDLTTVLVAYSPSAPTLHSDEQWKTMHGAVLFVLPRFYKRHDGSNSVHDKSWHGE